MKRIRSRLCIFFTGDILSIMIYKLIVLLLSGVNICYSDSIPRPRGVPLSMMSLYPTEGTFSCFDGSLSIPFDYINDDYCDCEGDGSDEPGTSACPIGSFYCNNIGHKPMFIPSSRVNDGICDCCDGSDEYAVWNISCPNNCFELGQAAREEEARLHAMYKEGSKLRVELTFKGKQIKREKQLRLLELTKEQSEAELVKNEKESIKNQIEEQEKAALDVYKQIEEQNRIQKEEEERIKNENEALQYFKQIDKNDDGTIDKNEVAGIELFDQNRDGVLSDDEIQILFANQETISFESFLENGWKYIKQLNAIQQVKGSTVESDQKEDSELDKEAHPEVESFKESEADGGKGEEEEEEEESEDETKDGLSPEDEEKDDVETSDVAAKTEYDEETNKIIEEANRVRSEFESAVRNLRDVQREIRQIEEALNKDYGKEDEFAYLVGECYEYTDREYIYKLCPFDQVSQRPKDGGIETRLGTWGNWVDNKYEVMHFGNGQSCWNGPQRQTHVKLKCSVQTEVVSASEPSRCEYLLEFNTPAVCSFKESPEEAIDLHDEL